MADRTRGITIEIGGDTTGLNKALKDVNKEINSSKSELKDIEKLLKLDPSNTELLAQKQRALSDAINSTKEKLDTLKEAQRQAAEQLANGNIGQNQYDALQREIIETEQQLQSLEQQAQETEVRLSSTGDSAETFGSKLSAASEAVQQAGDKIQEVGGKIEDAGTKLLPVTGAITAVGTAAVKTASDFDSSMSQVAAVSGATGDDLDALREKAREMGSMTKFSASEAADAMNYMAMAGWKTGDMLSGIEGIMNLAAASGEDLATTSDIVTDALTAFGMTAADSTHFADILAAASSNANTNVGMMGETFKYVAPVAGSLGYSAEDTATAIGLMANSGIKASQAGTALRSIMTRMAKPTEESADAMYLLGVSMTDEEGKMYSLMEVMEQLRKGFAGGTITQEEYTEAVSNWDKMLADGSVDLGEYTRAIEALDIALNGTTEAQQAELAAMLGGKEAMSGLLAIVNASEEDFNKLTNAIYNSEGSAETMAATMQDNLEGQMTILKSQLEELAISFGEILMPAIRQIVTWIQGFVDKLNSMDERTKKIITVVALVAAAIGPVLIIIGKIVTGVGALVKVIGLLMNPATLIIAAIVAIIAVLVTLYNKCEWFRNLVNNIVTAIVERVKNAVETIKVIIQLIVVAWEALKAKFADAVEWWNGVWGNISGFFSEVWNGIIIFFTETIPNAWNSLVAFFTGIPEWWQGVWQDIGTFFSNAWNAILENPIISTIIETITTLWTNAITTIQSIWNGLKDIASGVWNLIKNTILGPVLLLIDLVTGDFDKLKEDAVKIWNNIREAGEKIWNGIKQVIGSIVTGFVTHVTTILTGMATIISTIWEQIKSVASTLWENIKTAISTKATEMKETAINLITALKDALPAIWESIKSTIQNKWESIKTYISTTVKNMKDNAVTAFKNMVIEIGNKLKELPQKVKDGFKDAIDFLKGLPAQALEWGRDFIEGFKNGIEEKIQAVIDKIKSLGDKIRELLHFSRPDKGPLRDYETWMPDFMQGLADGIKNSQYLVTDALKGLANSMNIQTDGISLSGDGYGINGVGDILRMMQQYLPYLAAGSDMRLDSGELVGALTPAINTELGRIRIREEAR